MGSAKKVSELMIFWRHQMGGTPFFCCNLGYDTVSPSEEPSQQPTEPTEEPSEEPSEEPTEEPKGWFVRIQN